MLLRLTGQNLYPAFTDNISLGKQLSLLWAQHVFLHTPAVNIISACYTPTHTHLPTPTHQTPCSCIYIRHYTLQFTMICIGLTVCFPDWTHNSILQCNIKHNFIRIPCERHVITEQILLHLVRYDVLFCITHLLVKPCSLTDKHQTFKERFASICAEGKGSSLSTRQHCTTVDKTVTLPYLLPQSQGTGVPNDCINRLWPHGHSSSLGTAFCHCRLWTSKSFWMVSQFLFFIQQIGLWATHLIYMKTLHTR
jgi:hypothetical protein